VEDLLLPHGRAHPVRYGHAPSPSNVADFLKLLYLEQNSKTLTHGMSLGSCTV
jgi:hypothetical protein